MATVKAKEDEKEVGKPKQAAVKAPQGPMPKKRRGALTSGTVTDSFGDKQRYCPSKRLKSAHRKSGPDGGPPVVSLRKFAAKLEEGADWLANKSASGRGY